jgi:hypothetical protein
MLRLRGATYLLLVLSYDAAQAALALALSRRLGIPLLALGGTFLFWYAIDLGTIAALGSLGSFAVPGPLGAALRPALAGAFALVALALGGGAWLARRERLPGRLAGARVLATLRQLGVRDAVEWAVWRALFYASFAGFAAATLPAFGIQVPPAALLACVPVTLSLSALPISVAGLGSTQVAMLVLYGAFADEASIVAYSLAHGACLVVLRVPIGLACWPALAAPAPALTERSPT